MKKQNEEKGLTVKDLIIILKTMPSDAIIVSDDGTGWLAEVRKGDVYSEEIEDYVAVLICGHGKNI